MHVWRTIKIPKINPLTSKNLTIASRYPSSHNLGNVIPDTVQTTNKSKRWQWKSNGWKINPKDDSRNPVGGISNQLMTLDIEWMEFLISWRQWKSSGWKINPKGDGGNQLETMEIQWMEFLISWRQWKSSGWIINPKDDSGNPLETMEIQWMEFLIS